MIAHQKKLLSDILRKKDLQTSTRAERSFKEANIVDAAEEMVTEESCRLNAIRYNISNQEELTQTLEQYAKHIMVNIQTLEGSRSNLNFLRILKLMILVDKYDPTMSSLQNEDGIDWIEERPRTWHSSRNLFNLFRWITYVFQSSRVQPRIIGISPRGKMIPGQDWGEQHEVGQRKRALGQFLAYWLKDGN